ncbi:MAG: N-acetyltransferase family protein [Algoriphagus sp.]|jgi:phosphinothricin acetyltransferase|uniref:GNAT family N-acetyltransferase n=1 Tax=Algoriphagus sp. TaxID=1872435 RepID=UPI002723CB40|nr:GNAT family N-acetyltransferase [Algoriphagus sp.]MDO8966110.1 N-acetyltransferase family protein [Algoriphagus sp.]MDP2041006.1 N-acetyltransferase family protein [Algoriphagus sp.]MDP3200978.1 N-acetyltransferase family protein [Algoriphagus sp.]MDP3472915.1 N-acetyltransferase family protein [Algoriphagus sp.]
MSFLIRNYQESDAPAILEIINDSILNTAHNYDYEPKSLGEITSQFGVKIQEGFPILVGEVNGEVLGYATFGKFRAKPGYNKTIEHSIYLNKKAQGKGLGSEMMRQLIQIASDKGYHVMIAGMDSENSGSYRFHARFGFKEVARMPEVGFKFGKWQTLVFMQLTLELKL